MLRAALHEATASHPDRAELRRDADEALDCHFASDPDGRIAVPDLLATICDDLGITLDLASCPDEWLGEPILPLPAEDTHSHPAERAIPSGWWPSPDPHPPPAH